MRRSHQARSPRLDRALVELTRAANYTRLWLLVAVWIAACAGQRGQRAAGRGIVAIGIGSGMSVKRVPRWVRRRRAVGCEQADADP